MNEGENKNEWLVTFVTHNSRVSERMINFIPPDILLDKEPEILDVSKQRFLCTLIGESIAYLEFETYIFNVLPDHVHMVVRVGSEQELINKIGRLKQYCDFKFRTSGLNGKLWARKFHRRFIHSERYLSNALKYVANNHIKHQGRWGKENIASFDPLFWQIVHTACAPTVALSCHCPLCRSGTATRE